MTLTAVSQPDYGRVVLVYTGVPAGTPLLRDGLPVRVPPLSGQGVVFDYEAQPGATATYTAGSDQVTLAHTLDGSWLVHPVKPSLSLSVTVRDDDPNEWEAPGTVHEVIGRRDPVVTHTLRTYHSGTLVFWTPWALRKAVVDLFADGTPILVNPKASCALDYEWVWGALRAEKPQPDGSGGVWWTVDYRRVAAPAGYITEHPGNTYLGVRSEPADTPYSSLLTSHATYGDVAVTPHPHGVTP